MKALEILKALSNGIIFAESLNIQIKEAIAELELLCNNKHIHKYLDKAIAELENLSGNQQLVDNHKTCDGCKHYSELVKGKSETICCTLDLDCIRKYVPKDRWESKE